MPLAKKFSGICCLRSKPCIEVLSTFFRVLNASKLAMSMQSAYIQDPLTVLFGAPLHHAGSSLGGQGVTGKRIDEADIALGYILTTQGWKRW